MLAKSFRAGRVSLEQFTREVFADTQAPSAPSREDDRRSVPKLAVRNKDSHKGDFGRVLLIGGSPGMAGAIGLAGMAALRAGAGLVRLAVPRDIQATVASYSCCYMTMSFEASDDATGDAVMKDLVGGLDWASVIVIGPGLGTGSMQQKLAMSLYFNAHQPMVVDADALNALAESNADPARHAGSRILTPHPGEFQRLIHSQSMPRAEMEEAAISLARQANVTILLKGHRTLITEGHRTFHNSTGNPGMATGGTGDVLSGMIGSLLGQGLNPLDAARLAAHWHGLAGDHVANSIGQHSLLASDIVEALGMVSEKLR